MRTTASNGAPSHLKSIGGWFAIQVCDYLMTSAGREHWMRARRRLSPADQVLQRLPDYFIVRALRELVPNPPQISPELEFNEFAEAAM